MCFIGTMFGNMKKTFFLVLAMAMALNAMAQSGTNSPYSQYGLGTQADQATGFSRGMDGLGIAYRDGGQLNFKNPASYSAMDSLTFIFDVGMSGQLTNFEENGKRLNAKNANIEYAVAGFRAFKHVGMSFGIVPFTNVGYNYSSTSKVGDINSTTYTNTYNGSGGLHQAYLGIGWEPFKGVSLGVNGSYLWGSYNRSIINSYSDEYVNTLSKYYSAEVASYKLDAGLQFSFNFSKKSNLTIGLTYGLGHSLGADPECRVISRNSQTAVSDTALYVLKDGLKIPTTLGAGLMLNLKGQLKVGADYTLQKWAEVGFPQYGVVDNKPSYQIKENYFKDRHKVTIGGEYCRKQDSRKFMDKVKYRVGVSYATPYLYINGGDGPKELSVSAGFGIPIVNAWNNRSTLNISGQWVRLDAPGLLKENTFRINVGITFNEKWFSKWKVE